MKSTKSWNDLISPSSAFNSMMNNKNNKTHNMVLNLTSFCFLPAMCCKLCSTCIWSGPIDAIWLWSCDLCDWELEHYWRKNCGAKILRHNQLHCRQHWRNNCIGHKITTDLIICSAWCWNAGSFLKWPAIEGVRVCLLSNIYPLLLCLCAFLRLNFKCNGKVCMCVMSYTPVAKVVSVITCPHLPHVIQPLTK